MKNVAFAVVALGMVACNNSPRLVDSGPIVLPDSGPGGHDSGPVMGHDSGPVTTGCSLTVAAGNFGSLTAGCFPRCSAATAMMAFGTGAGQCGAMTGNAGAMCQQAAINADTTASTTVTIGTNSQQLDCGGCVQFQLLHCASANGCSSQVDAFLSCSSMALPDGGVPACTTEIDNLNTCINAQAGVGTCENDMTMGIVACFG